MAACQVKELYFMLRHRVSVVYSQLAVTTPLSLLWLLFLHLIVEVSGHFDYLY